MLGKIGCFKKNVLQSVELPVEAQLMFNCDEMFKNLGTDYLREKFYKDSLNLIEAERVFLGSKFKLTNRKGRRKFSKVHVYGYRVPFLKNVESLLSLPEVQEMIGITSGEFETECMYDVTDGNYFKSNNFYQSHPNALLYNAYVDDFELVNPIGSHRKTHKLTAFYFQMLNIKSEKRSTLASIQLIAFAKTQDVKRFGMRGLLQD